MAVALTLLKDGKGDAVVSAGSTGALLTGATLTVKRIRGIRRAALAPVLPAGEHGVMLIDCGANVECTAEYLLQFAYMGSFYARKLMGCENPRVGLLNVGTEDTKGGELQHHAFQLLKQAGDEGRIRFVGNVEGTGVFSGAADVIVTDGFTGNILLKGAEGIIKYMMKSLKGVFYKSTKNKLAAAVLKNDLGAMKKSLDVNEIGGTAMIGISKPVIKAHGSSNSSSIFAAIRQAIAFAESGIIDDIKADIDNMKISANEEL
jgi:glycerol-3-phosphate acyltransferase PlsX